MATRGARFTFRTHPGTESIGYGPRVDVLLRSDGTLLGSVRRLTGGGAHRWQVYDVLGDEDGTAHTRVGAAMDLLVTHDLAAS